MGRRSGGAGGGAAGPVTVQHMKATSSERTSEHVPYWAHLVRLEHGLVALFEGQADRVSVPQQLLVVEHRAPLEPSLRQLNLQHPLHRPHHKGRRFVLLGGHTHVIEPAHPTNRELH